ncbi:MAG: amine oxidase [Planctomycetota bacterium]|nr:MAG: amine oxidase [Planctomycetota bacterium]
MERAGSSKHTEVTRVDTLVVGAGFGGLAAALTLAEHGQSVRLHERLRYPGGCASSFEREGFRFEAGATLFSGLERGQLFGDWIARHKLDVQVDWIDPLVEFRCGARVLRVPRRREGLLEALCAEPGAPEARLRAFFAEQRRVADTLWELLDRPELLPPFDLRALLQHCKGLPRYLRLLRHVGRSLLRVLRGFELHEYRPLLEYLEGACQITVQCGVAEAEAPFALATMDYYYRGTGHVRGGIGELAWGLTRALEQCGGDARFADAVQGVTRLDARSASDPRWEVRTRSGSVRCRDLLLNMLPHDAGDLLRESGAEHATLQRALQRSSARVDAGWGACMLYLVARAPVGADDAAHHLQLVQDANAPYRDGNHLFCSISGAHDGDRAPPGRRTLTVSTHVQPTELRALSDPAQGERVAAIQQHMRAGLATLAPEWWQGVEHELSASPRTFQRFTGRHAGLVGGVPRRAGLRPYFALFDSPRAPGLQLVGDSQFPGQSTLAAALGGARAAARVLRTRAPAHSSVAGGMLPGP